MAHSFPRILVVLGPPETGKTTAMQHLYALHVECPHVVIPAVRGAHLSDFFGVWILRNGETEFIEGPLYRALL